MKDKSKKTNPVNRIKIKRYGNFKENNLGYSGYMEPEDGEWILYFDEDGKPSVYYGRRAEDGGAYDDSRIDLSP